MSEHAGRKGLPEMPPFAAFYEAVNGHNPFPWQARLAETVENGAGWPEEVGVPTGLGKTACLDIAIWWLASQAHLPPAERTAPTRIWWVVNRRLLVDSTCDHAEHIQGLLSPSAHTPSNTPTASGVIESVADRLRSLSVDAKAEPLEVVRLRGGVAWRRPTDPSQPAVVLSTIPMYGSRLLFRGYGSSRSMRPVDAALAGTDSLVLVDEAHLARHLMRLFPALQECVPQIRPLLNAARAVPRVVALTATGSAGNGRFDLDDEDMKHPEIRRRLDAAKPTEVWERNSGDQVKALAGAALSLLDAARAPATCVVFVNSPGTARAVKDRLKGVLLKQKKRHLTAQDIIVLTGQTREREAKAARTRILGEMSARQPVKGRSRHLVVVATQTLEVGADIDAEFLVTEACGVRSLTQRLGRLNRLGSHPHARAIYVHCPPRRKDGGWSVYRDEPATVLDRLLDHAEVAADGSKTVDLSPRRVADVLGEPDDDPGRAPEVLPALLWEWIKTTTPPPGEAPVDPYFSGIAQPDRSVSLMWRVHVPEAGQRLWPRPRDVEFVDVPIGEFREAIDGDEELRRLGPDGITVEAIQLDDLQPGDQIVLATDQGRLDSDGWAPDSTAPVVDVSILDQGLPLDAGALRRLCHVQAADVEALIDTMTGRVDDEEEVGDSRREAALVEFSEILREHSPSGLTDDDYSESDLAGWDDFVSQLTGSGDLSSIAVRDEVPRLRGSRRAGNLRVDDLDEMSLAEAAAGLDGHGRDVGTRAGWVAAAVGLPSELVAIMERAGRFHDVGKADSRFQRWLDPDGREPRPVAKSSMPRSWWSAARAASGWPRGGRHEDLSARLVREWLTSQNGQLDDATADLLLHLVISHHGKGRPLVPPAEDGTLALVTYELDGIEVSCPADLSHIDWTQPSRFRRLNDLYGPWGLALLEAIIRQADHAVSAGARLSDLEVR